MIEVDFTIHIRRNGKPFLNSTAVRLLEEIDRCGSLRIAARGLRYSYQHAWDVINEVNRAAAEPVVIKQRGGAGGGGAYLSSHGKRLLAEFTTIERLAKSFTKKLNAEMNH